jgi:phosphoribosylanthranilate isomerase
MWIKICGTTNLEDAILAADAGADAVGFVFASSPRRMTAAQVAEITPELPASLRKIGVFNTQDFDEIVFALRTAGLNGVQLHGELDFRLTEKLRDAFGSEFFLMQTLHWNVNSGSPRAAEKLRNELRAVSRHSGIDAVLLDTRTANASGGTGQTFDWARARQVLGDEAGDLRIIAAGGLHPYNVADAIRTLTPWGVDVASGVELHAGRKDPVHVRTFIQAARAAFSEVEKLTRRTPAVSPH